MEQISILNSIFYDKIRISVFNKIREEFKRDFMNDLYIKFDVIKWGKL